MPLYDDRRGNITLKFISWDSEYDGTEQIELFPQKLNLDLKGTPKIYLSIEGKK